MSIILAKGSQYSANYSSVDYPVLSADWTATLEIFKEFPGTATHLFNLVRSGNVMQLLLPIETVQNLPIGTWYFVVTFINSVTGERIQSVEYCTVTAIPQSSALLCKIFGTIIKSDGTAAGNETTTLVTNSTSVGLGYGWKGITITCAIAVVSVTDGKVVDTEMLSKETDANGYFEFYVIRGTTQKISCSYLGSTITVDTTGKTSVDITTLL